jgi:hypothetical protein
MKINSTGSNSVNTGLKILLAIHGIATVAAGSVLIIAPGWIPATVNIVIDPGTFLVCYLLASAELAIGFISFAALFLKDLRSLQIICTMFIILHASAACLELYALSKGVSTKIWTNIMARIVIILLFTYFGLYKNRRNETAG